ncbi:MAG: putative dithiol-disulfide isomerase [Acidimicrobiaceae bacterium]|jgi:predicted DsbA family dithiol-disulfide isomerase|nr:putative dithiol-disulfide isomerase [Acidimicrobiaceae bacterium]
MKVEIWSDVVCPWCYLGKKRFERALDSFEHRGEVEVVYRSFELDPSAPPGRTVPTIDLLASKYGMSADQAADAQRQMEQRAGQDGLAFHLEDLQSGNTRDAHRLLHLAQAHARQPELLERLHRAYFSEQLSIFDHSSLTDLAVEVGLDRDEVSRLLAGDDYAGAVDDDEETARALGATGVPFFVIDRRYGISGAQSAEEIAQVLDRAWADAVTSGAPAT